MSSRDCIRSTSRKRRPCNLLDCYHKTTVFTHKILFKGLFTLREIYPASYTSLVYGQHRRKSTHTLLLPLPPSLLKVNNPLLNVVNLSHMVNGPLNHHLMLLNMHLTSPCSSYPSGPSNFALNFNCPSSFPTRHLSTSSTSRKSASLVGSPTCRK